MPEVFVAPDDTARRLREYVREHPDVQKDQYQGSYSDPIQGACYVLAEAYFHAEGGQDAFDVYRIGWDDVYEDGAGAHWFLRRTADDAVVDLSLPTPDHGADLPWDAGRCRAFITGYTPSNRTQRVLEALELSS